MQYSTSLTGLELKAGVGLTVIVNIIVSPTQLLTVGVTTKVAVTGAVPELVAVKAAMSPDPLPARPIDGVSLVQLYVVPTAFPVKLIALVKT